MTVDEIKNNYSMRDVLAMKGVEVKRSGMCSCPFHKDNKPSMKVYKDSYYCFSCHRSGDIFTFIQTLENCDFKTAFISLGGTYEHEQNEVKKRLIQAKFDKQKNDRNQTKQAQTDFKQLLENAIDKCNVLISKEEVFSDTWCNAQNKLTFLQGVWDQKYLEGNEVNEIDVIRVCRQIGC